MRIIDRFYLRLAKHNPIDGNGLGKYPLCESRALLEGGLESAPGCPPEQAPIFAVEVPARHLGSSIPADVVHTDASVRRLAIRESFENGRFGGSAGEVEFVRPVRHESLARELGFHEKAAIRGMLADVGILTPTNEGIAVWEELEVSSLLGSTSIGSASIVSFSHRVSGAMMRSELEVVPRPPLLNCRNPRRFVQANDES